MKIAVVGASGNAGSRIVTELASRGHTVTAIARHPEKIAEPAQRHGEAGRRAWTRPAWPRCSPAMMPRSARCISSTAIRPG